MCNHTYVTGGYRTSSVPYLEDSKARLPGCVGIGVIGVILVSVSAVRVYQ